MEIENFTLGPFETNAWLLTDTTAGRCVLVDAPPGAGKTILPEIRARGLALEALLLTHGHWDHMADAHHFATPGTMVCAHRDDAGCFSNPEHYAPWYRLALPHLTEADFQPVPISNWVEDGGTLPLLGKTWEVRHVPGHCPGNILFFCAQEHAAFPGDAIFAGSVGRSDLPGGSWPVLLKSIRERIYTLPDATALYPGHGSPTRVGDEKRLNPYARPLPGN
ncbi:MAG: MBL fold metallo-hydrolase [Puniceicoccales bacterium]|jgi:glyoxylase-like metal-dependent hydrolase (beta-lactamase superfamily II)|nr:MBL fold metallo-hydrolase [Puniceicoccales bacterium]